MISWYKSNIYFAEYSEKQNNKLTIMTRWISVFVTSLYAISSNKLLIACPSSLLDHHHHNQKRIFFGTVWTNKFITQKWDDNRPFLVWWLLTAWFIKWWENRLQSQLSRSTSMNTVWKVRQSFLNFHTLALFSHLNFNSCMLSVRTFFGSN